MATARNTFTGVCVYLHLSRKITYLKLIPSHCHREELAFLWHPEQAKIQSNICYCSEGKWGYWEEGKKREAKSKTRQETILVVNSCKTLKSSTNTRKRKTPWGAIIFLQNAIIMENNTFGKEEGIMQANMSFTLPEFLDIDLDTKKYLAKSAMYAEYHARNTRLLFQVSTEAATSDKDTETLLSR